MNDASTRKYEVATGLVIICLSFGLLAFAEAVGCLPSQTLMVGDSSHDLIAGRNAGMQAAGVLTGIAKAVDLAPYADVVLPDIGHLPRWLAA